MDTHIECGVDVEAELGVLRLHAKGRQRWPATPPKPCQARARSPHLPPEGTSQLHGSLMSDLQPSEEGE